MLFNHPVFLLALYPEGVPRSIKSLLQQKSLTWTVIVKHGLHTKVNVGRKRLCDSTVRMLTVTGNQYT